MGSRLDSFSFESNLVDLDITVDTEEVHQKLHCKASPVLDPMRGIDFTISTLPPSASAMITTVQPWLRLWDITPGGIRSNRTHLTSDSNQLHLKTAVSLLTAVTPQVRVLKLVDADGVVPH
ncbi:hypothetical protein EYF80_029565 [Liparis tanakae]|uniref:Uncharacterized protein n=1 Tax=Liparis tanakae TaxID=230148 RepID=A0A4Z2H446_9TELE|nr:hypothetical protein EYF80_029565 [Liparis tanakae]